MLTNMIDKQVISTQDAPKAIGPYSQAVKSGGFLFISGQIPLDPKTSQIAGATIAEQTKQVLKNLKAILETANLHLENVVKTTVYLKDLSEFPQMNEVYAKFFTQNPPARATVEVSRLPKDVKIEIDAIAKA